MAGTSSRACSCACAIPAKNSSSATRMNGPSRAPSGPVPSPPAGDAARDGTDQVGADRDLRWHGRGRHLLHAAAGQGNGGDGPSALKLWISSTTADADIFAVLRVFDRQGKEVVFQGALDPHTPIAQGWLRASHRKLDPRLSLPYRPYHTHDEKQPPSRARSTRSTSRSGPRASSCRRATASRSRSAARTTSGRRSGGAFQHEEPDARLRPVRVHDDATDRPPEVFGGKVTLHVGPIGRRARCRR